MDHHLKQICLLIFLYYSFWYGPLPPELCKLTLYMKNTIAIQLMLFFDVMLLTKYLAVFWLKNPFGFQDDFWSLFINIWIPSFSHLLQFVLDYKYDSCGKIYYFCSRKSCGGALAPSNRELGMSSVASISILIFFFISSKSRYKKILLSDLPLLWKFLIKIIRFYIFLSTSW